MKRLLSRKSKSQNAAESQLIWTALVALVMGWAAMKHYSTTPHSNLANFDANLQANVQAHNLETSRAISSLINQ